MRAVLTQKVVSSPTIYGEKIGGKVTTSNPGNIEIVTLDNVTSVVEQTEGPISFYAITHKTGSDSDYHTSNYSKENYIISVMGG